MLTSVASLFRIVASAPRRLSICVSSPAMSTNCVTTTSSVPTMYQR
jgi:hypothetical protein